MLREQTSLITLLRSLETKHAGLKEQVGEETACPLPHHFRVQLLKRLRLRTKDQIALIARKLRIRSGNNAPDTA